MSEKTIFKYILEESKNDKTVTQYQDTKNIEINFWGNYSNVRSLSFSREEGKKLYEILKEFYE